MNTHPAPLAQPTVIHAPLPATLWLGYALTRGITARHRRAALAHFGTPGALGEALLGVVRPPLLASADLHLDSWPATLRRALASAETTAAFQAATAWQQAGPERHLIGLDHPCYPPALLATSDPPPLLYLRGSLARLDGPWVAIVGSRQATGPALEQAHRLAGALVDAGIGVVSGLARGIDAAAHRGALDHGGPTIAVQATAPDRIYPAAHRELATAIADEGLLLTEFPPGNVLRPGCFPRRNRLISGLSLGVIVVEATLRSGSLITARHAADQGRDVMAMPGSVANPQVRGCHELLRQGATLVESADDVLLALQPALQQSLHPAPAARHGADETVMSRRADNRTDNAADNTMTDPDAMAMLQLLGFDAMSIDMLVERSELPASQVSRALAQLELAGHVITAAGGRYQRCNTPAHPGN